MTHIDHGVAGSAVCGLLSPYDALCVWRSRQEAAGRPGIDAVKDVYLLQIARGDDLSSAQAITQRLPRSLAPFADEIAAVVTGAWSGRQARRHRTRAVHHHAPESKRTHLSGGRLETQAPVARNQVAADPETLTTVAANTATPEVSIPVAGAANGDPSVAADSAEVATTVDQSRPPSVEAIDFGAIDFGAIDLEAFTPFDFSQPAAEPGTLRATIAPTGTSLTWTAFETHQPIVIYRVVSRDDGPPWSPDEADVALVTEQTSGLDPRPPGSAVRHFQVWANAGASRQAAQQAQPTLVAGVSLVSPVIDLVIREEDGAVIGQWSVWDGVSNVQILRIPIAKAAHSAGNSVYRILEFDVNLGGFVDREADRGRQYLYQVYTEAIVDDVIKLSSPINVPIKVSAALERVGDLAVHQFRHGGDRLFDVSWTAPPAGKVVVFRSEGGPAPGSTTAEIGESALTQTGLNMDSSLARPINPIGDGRVGMSSVPWPRAWNRAFFTPVTILEGRAVLGTTIAATDTDTITDAKITERVDRQVVTFSWPAGASSVLMFTGPIGGDAAAAVTGRPVEITREDWEKLGGLHLRDTLPSVGCTIHLVPVAFDDGRRVNGEPCSVKYPFLVRMYYRIDIKRNLLRKPVSALISLVAADPIAVPTAFVLVHHQTRLPLDIDDGELLRVSLDGEPGAQLSNRIVLDHMITEPDGNRWRAELSKRGGFIRLFVDIDAARLSRWALIDPPIGELCLD